MGLLEKLFGKKNVNKAFDIDKYNRANQKQIDKIKSVYDMDSISGIQAIPVPTAKEPPENLPAVVVKVEYILQRKATEHKKAGRMELAIECLKKSNEIMPYSSVGYLKKDYERLVEFLKQAGRFDEARAEQERLDSIFGDMQITKEEAAKMRSRNANSGTDLVHVTGHLGCCAECAKYRDRIYSLSGASNKYPPYPQFLVENEGHCGLIEYPFYDGFSGFRTMHNGDVDPAAYSNRPFIDDRTGDERARYDESQRKTREEAANRKNYDLLRELFPDLAPKSFGGYVRMKNANSPNFQSIVSKVKEAGYFFEE
ncbi:phage minor capsid protein [Ruminococcaceae bacterium OttesenSCG-928-D13]|nr:phage minor capsid protein [Ruminococcaceae bacterium OttesenSCG-928-D13]